MNTIEWAYMRKGWQSCTKAQKFFDQNNIKTKKIVDARKETIKEKTAWKLINSFDKIIVSKGKKIVEFKLSPDNRDEIMKASLGRTGNLRAPAVQIDAVLYIGFNDNIYNDLLSVSIWNLFFKGYINDAFVRAKNKTLHKNG